ncbi:MAG: ATPase, T2SS/T4P/T4SS family [Eubacteriales bacterium]|nr:ATPase, T2SS/T4P/T4SS family [Eubacteriales bacterium]
MNEQQLKILREELMECLDTEEELSDQEVQKEIDELLMKRKGTWYLSMKDCVALRRELFDSVRRLDVLQELLEDETVTEIMVNGPNSIFVEREGKIRNYERTFSSGEKLMDVIQQIAGRCNRIINESSPVVDARLPDGARVNAVVSPVALDGPVLTIRRFPKDPITMDRLIGMGSITEECVEFLRKLVTARYSILIGGGTGSGKTTFLGALAQYIPKDERIITIEDNAELKIRGIDNLVRLEAKQANLEGGREVSIRDLIRTSLRMRPDRIIVGEVRGAEAVDMLQALNTGHEGSLGTAHANSSLDMLSRLEMMVLMGMSLPLPAIRSQIASGIDILVHLGRMPDGTRKVMEISEVLGYREGEIRLGILYERREGILRKKEELYHQEKLQRIGIRL